jgi:hypothetical protein
MRALPRAAFWCSWCFASVGCAPDEAPALVDAVWAAPGASGAGRGDPARAVNGVRGAGEHAGSLDVYSLPPGEDAWLALDLGGTLRDGPGAELVVFENPFLISGGPRRFMDPLVVEVSADGERWLAFPHDYRAPDETRYAWNPEDWVGFAGITPVRLHEEDAPGDPFDAEAAGGDAFDLAALPGDEGAALRARGVRYVRLVSARIATNPDTGLPFPSDPLSDGPDVDGVYVRHLD